MAKKAIKKANSTAKPKENIRFTYYPGCSSQGSALHLDESVRAVVPEIELELEELDNWNCCGASVGHIGASAATRREMTMSSSSWQTTIEPGSNASVTKHHSRCCPILRDRTPSPWGSLMDGEGMSGRALQPTGDRKVPEMVLNLVQMFHQKVSAAQRTAENGSEFIKPALELWALRKAYNQRELDFGVPF